MKAGMFLRCALVAVVCCTMMVGCKKGCKGKGSGSGTGTDNVGGVTGAGAEGSNLPGRDTGTGAEDRAKFQAQTVYFAYDSAAINPAEQSKIQAVATELKGGGMKVLVEGHCDERGTAEYNRALGERRALAVREALVGAGVDGSNIQTISYGKDRPSDPGHDEAAWSKNRRAEFVVIH